jgi:hypothetical protein
MAEPQRKARPRGNEDTVSQDQSKKLTQTTEVVVTLSPAGEIIKVEKLDKSGRRTQVSEKEIAALAGDDVLDDLSEVLQEAYVAGISDAIEDDMLEDGEDDEGESIIQAYIFRRSVGRTQLRRHARQLILRQALLRRVVTEKKQPARGALRKKLRDAGGPGETKH